MGLVGIHNGLERMVGFQRGERAWVELGWVVVARVVLGWVGLETTPPKANPFSPCPSPQAADGKPDQHGGARGVR